MKKSPFSAKMVRAMFAKTKTGNELLEVLAVIEATAA